MSFEQVVIGICDNEKEAVTQIQAALYQCIQELGEKMPLHVSLFTDGRQLYEESLSKKFDLVFLDWEMPGWDGFELANRLNMKHTSLQIVFVSSHENMAFDSFAYTPLWFVRKNHLERDMLRAVTKYAEVTAHTKVTYRLKEGLAERDLRIKDILYIESCNHNQIIHLKHGDTYRVYKSLSAMEKELIKNRFLRIHKSYLVNQAYIQEVEQKNVRLKDGSELPLGKDRRKYVKEEMVRYERGLD